MFFFIAQVVSSRRLSSYLILETPEIWMDNWRILDSPKENGVVSERPFGGGVIAGGHGGGGAAAHRCPERPHKGGPAVGVGPDQAFALPSTCPRVCAVCLRLCVHTTVWKPTGLIRTEETEFLLRKVLRHFCTGGWGSLGTQKIFLAPKSIFSLSHFFCQFV